MSSKSLNLQYNQPVDRPLRSSTSSVMNPSSIREDIMHPERNPYRSINRLIKKFIADVANYSIKFDSARSTQDEYGDGARSIQEFTVDPEIREKQPDKSLESIKEDPAAELSSVKNSMVMTQPYLMLQTQPTITVNPAAITTRNKPPVRLSCLGISSSAGSDFQPSSLKNSLPLSHSDNEVVTTSFIQTHRQLRRLRPRNTNSQLSSHRDSASTQRYTYDVAQENSARPISCGKAKPSLRLSMSNSFERSVGRVSASMLSRSYNTIPLALLVPQNASVERVKRLVDLASEDGLILIKLDN